MHVFWSGINNMNRTSSQKIRKEPSKCSIFSNGRHLPHKIEHLPISDTSLIFNSIPPKQRHVVDGPKSEHLHSNDMRLANQHDAEGTVRTSIGLVSPSDCVFVEQEINSIADVWLDGRGDGAMHQIRD